MNSLHGVSLNCRSAIVKNIAMLTSILMFALILRCVFYTGFMGSDEVVYNDAAFGILNGDWPVSNYIGAIRYGVNIPVAMSMALFGVSEWSANLWSLLCSLGEIVLVYIFGKRVFGEKVAVMSAFLLAALPLHVHYAGRMMADSPLAFFITLAFFLFYYAEQSNSKKQYFYCGAALGFAYWIKSVVPILALPIFLLYAVAYRRFTINWIWIILGASLLVFLNMMLMWKVTGNPLHVHVRPGKSVDNILNDPSKITDLSYYFDYLFIRVNHTWLLGPLTVLGVYKLWVDKRLFSREVILLLSWIIGYILVLTFTVISFNPFMWIFKQPNYMLLFVAPMSLISGYYLAKIKIFNQFLLISLYFFGSVILSALVQQSIRVFVSNSYAAAEFSRTVDGIPVYGSQNNFMVARSIDDFSHDGKKEIVIRSLDQLTQNKWVDAQDNQSDVSAYAILDMQTITWGKNPDLTPEKVPTCWRYTGRLEPTGFGMGEKFIFWVRKLFYFSGVNMLSSYVLKETELLYRPKPAYIYAIPKDCNFTI
ncbi:glycosyltransferase family 39 protein [Methylotuvimicrobium buryatense]|uniref:Phospholipid carrier-dependent glycosyltransferase n=1 Tax=Methylotuvimicrobium buryatense TaxID=95641 RepID=A0A4P9UNC5_METBY|nr:glycosyltransferase family 39 protein [Methylotuvimicrobium buryatense]QCW81983.1 phospholipid carrier-dependent glycosyltransferase [Methylotuvimicrobium buryatense]